MHDNVDLLMSASLSPRQNVEVLHLIDCQLQPGVRLDYHCVYESFDSVRQTATYGIFLANPWKRNEYEPRPESRHYFTGGKELIVVEDSRNSGREFEFLQGGLTDAAETRGAEYAKQVSAFEADLCRVQHGTPIKPMSLVFAQFARRK